MGLFGFGKKTSEASAATRVSTGPDVVELGTTQAWQLRRGASGVVVQLNDQGWADGIRSTVPKVPRVGHTVELELKRDRKGTVWVFHDGVHIGELDAAASKSYASIFTALERTKRHAKVTANVTDPAWKTAGATVLVLAHPQHPLIPINQPPTGIPLVDVEDLDVKDENLYKSFLVSVARKDWRAPGWFVLTPADPNTGEVNVYCPMVGKPLPGEQVGVVAKSATKKAAALTASGPVAVAGVIDYEGQVPQVGLDSFFG